MSMGYEVMRLATYRAELVGILLEKDLGIKPKVQNMIHLIEKQTNPATSVGNDPCEGLLCLTETSSSQAEPVLVDWL